MRILKFEGATIRDAVAKVKAELGDQAVILSSRQIRRGLLGTAVEISAAIDDGDERPARGPEALGAAAPAAPAARESDPDLERLIAPLRGELRSLRAMVRTAGGEGRGLGRLETEVAALRRLVESLRAPEAGPALAPSADETIEPLIAPSEARQVMVVGPTGVGKTTTIAKLAARAALVEGRRVRLVTLDTYRVGGVDQIRSFAELIGIPLEILDHPARLAGVLEDRDSDELVLIDTAGRSPRDREPIAELAAALHTLPAIEVHLLVPASLDASGIDRLVRHYAVTGVSRLLFTKLDEHDTALELLRAPRRHRLPVTWVATGQAVPEDLEQPGPARVTELAAHGVSTAPPFLPRPRGYRAA